MSRRIMLVAAGLTAVVLLFAGYTLATEGAGFDAWRGLLRKELPPKDSAIYGTVVDAATGQAIANAYVRGFDGDSTRTDESGKFVVTGDVWSAVELAARKADPSLAESAKKWPEDKYRAICDGLLTAPMTVRVSAHGYMPGEATADLGVGTRMTVEVRLQPRASREVSEETVWSDAKAKSKVKCLKPNWLPEGFVIADLFDAGSRGDDFARDNPSASDGRPQVQYNNGEQTLIIFNGVVGDFGEQAGKDVGEVRGVPAKAYGADGELYVTWTEKQGADEVHYTVHGKGDPTKMTTETLLRVARSMQEF